MITSSESRSSSISGVFLDIQTAILYVSERRTVPRIVLLTRYTSHLATGFYTGLFRLFPPFFDAHERTVVSSENSSTQKTVTRLISFAWTLKIQLVILKTPRAYFFQRNITAANKPRKLLRRSRSKFCQISKQRFATLKKWPFLPSESDPPSKRKSTGRASPGRQLFAMRRFKTAAA